MDEQAIMRVCGTSWWDRRSSVRPCCAACSLLMALDSFATFHVVAASFIIGLAWAVGHANRWASGEAVGTCPKLFKLVVVPAQKWWAAIPEQSDQPINL